MKNIFEIRYLWYYVGYTILWSENNYIRNN